ncbi:ubiquitin-conjugating enzyme [Ceratobasidium sp. AG-Ba]|nr:ubiquitin-conjugating enzyme [Ceratobasidium sp. AG-Ba]QRV99528.1 ubiquitin-conjugating enzyme [Ceratobasidium sp. AG-Ba]QRW14039.1 ubiquitin-conjugating enzyme [Ceratobasidium sp. AG-Ba]
MNVVEQVSPAAFRKLVKEITQLRNEPPEGIRVVTNEENMLDVTGIIAGPEGTPYAGGYFHVRFSFGDDFPAAPPRAAMLTKIFHPNVSRSGEICVNTLKKDWKPTYGLGHILVTIKCLLIYPNPESALDEESGKLLLEDWDEFCGRAKMWTSVHATPKVPPVEFNTPSSSKSAPASAPAPPSNPSPTTAAVQPTTTPAANLKSKLDPVQPTQVPQVPLQPSSANNAAPILPTPVLSATAAGTENGNVETAKKEGAVPATKTKRAATGGVEKKKKALKRL